MTEDEAIEVLKDFKKRINTWHAELVEEDIQAIETILDLYQHKKGRIDELKQELLQEKEKNKNTGKLVKNKIDEKIGIVLREWETGQIQVLEKIQPKVINTHDSWKTLEVIEDE